jgi:hypothetical protein
MEDPAIHFTVSSQMVFRRSCLLSSRSSDMVAPLSLGSLFYWSSQVLPDISSHMFILSRFLVQYFPWSAFSVLLPSVCYDRVLYTMPLLPGRSSLCRWRPTPGSISSADCSTLQLDAGPHAASSVLQQASLQPLP